MDDIEIIKGPGFNFRVNKRFIFAVEISNPNLLQKVTKIAQVCRGTIVETVEKNSLPDALVSDSQYASFLENLTHEQKIQNLKVLPLIMKDAVYCRVPIIHTASFLETWNNYQKSKTSSRIPLKKRPLTGIATGIAIPRVSKPRNEVILIDDTGDVGLTRVGTTDIVLRDKNESYRTIHKQLKNLPLLHFGSDFGMSLFHPASHEVRKRRIQEIEKEKHGDFLYQNVSAQPFKKYVAPETAKPAHGYCEVCRTSSSDINEHYVTPSHEIRTGAPGFYDELDKIIEDWNDPIFDPDRRAKQLGNKDSVNREGLNLHDMIQLENEERFLCIPAVNENANAATAIDGLNNNVSDDFMDRS